MAYDVFQQKADQATETLITENLDVFGTSSNGSIVLQNTTNLPGDTETQRFFGGLPAVVDRNAYDLTGTQNPVEIATMTANAVTCDFGIPTYKITESMLQRMMGNSQETDILAAQKATELSAAFTAAELQRAVSGAVAVASLNPNNVLTIEAPTSGSVGDLGNLTVDSIYAGLARFGDAYGRLGAIVMHSNQFFSLARTDLIKNGTQLFKAADLAGNGVSVIELVTGQRVVVTDAPALLGNTLLLSQQAIMMKALNVNSVYERRAGNVNIYGLGQHETSCRIGFRNARLKSSVLSAIEGTKSIDSATFANPASWERVQKDSDKKDIGVLIKFTAKAA